ncbi:collagen alpha-2(I) chain-like [Cavia porcellus]|uniref:collagen alpha-2(I) chain-like n=1 Tax=Cavia porcellus TaxID=10141 RepID=UPI002FDFF27E
MSAGAPPPRGARLRRADPRGRTSSSGQGSLRGRRRGRRRLGGRAPGWRARRSPGRRGSPPARRAPMLAGAGRQSQRGAALASGPGALRRGFGGTRALDDSATQAAAGPLHECPIGAMSGLRRRSAPLKLPGAPSERTFCRRPGQGQRETGEAGARGEGAWSAGRGDARRRRRAEEARGDPGAPPPAPTAPSAEPPALLGRLPLRVCRSARSPPPPRAGPNSARLARLTSPAFPAPRMGARAPARPRL